MLSTALSIPIGKTVTHHCSILVGTGGCRFFSRVVAAMSSTHIITKCRNKLYQYTMDCTDRDIFTNKSCNNFHATCYTKEVTKTTWNLEVWDLRIKGPLLWNKISLCLLFTTKSRNKVPYLQPGIPIYNRVSYLQPGIPYLQPWLWTYLSVCACMRACVRVCVCVCVCVLLLDTPIYQVMNGRP